MYVVILIFIFIELDFIREHLKSIKNIMEKGGAT